MGNRLTQHGFLDASWRQVTVALPRGEPCPRCGQRTPALHAQERKSGRADPRSLDYRHSPCEANGLASANHDRCLDHYNTTRPHHSYRTKGRTPLQTFDEGLAASQEEEASAA